MVNFILGNFTLSPTLTNMIQCVDSQQYFMGQCTGIKYIAEPTAIYKEEPRQPLAHEELHLIPSLAGNGLQGKFALYIHKDKTSCSEQQARAHIDKKVVDEEKVKAYLGNEISPLKLEQTLYAERILINSPINTHIKVDSVTMSALIRSSGYSYFKELQNQRVFTLMNQLDLTIIQAQALVTCDIDDGLIHKNGEWHSKHVDFVSPPTLEDLLILVERGLMQRVSPKCFKVSATGSQAVKRNLL